MCCSEVIDFLIMLGHNRAVFRMGLKRLISKFTFSLSAETHIGNSVRSIALALRGLVGFGMEVLRLVELLCSGNKLDNVR